MASGFDRVNGTAPDLDRAQRRIQDSQQRSQANDADGAELKLTISSASPKKIAHKLGRKPQGYSERSASGDGTGSLQMDESSSKDITFSLKVPTGAPTTTISYKLWVY